MSAPTFSQSASTATATPRAIPPYAGPAPVAPTGLFAGKVGPFVPAAEREREGWGAPAVAEPPRTAVLNPTVSVATIPTPVAAVEAIPTPPAASALGASAPTEMSVPASIPPYRPLRPTPIVTPAIRTPLYIPPIPTPAGEAVVEDEGVIEPMLVHTSEFAVPSAFADVPVSEAATSNDVVAESFGAVEEALAADETVAEAEQPAELPWIDSFLANTPVMPMEAVATPAPAMQALAEIEGAADAPVGESVEESVAEPVADPVVEQAAPELIEMAEASLVEVSAAEAEAELVADAADEWPLDEAAVEFRALRDALDAQKSQETAEVAEHDEAAAPRPEAQHAELPEWSDDDMMDIMPIRHLGKTPLSSAAIPPDGELWAERARKAHEEAQVFRAMASAQAEPHDTDRAEADRGDAEERAAPLEATAEEAAHALEVLARRVRAGELMLPSYDPRMGEPAALVAALAALLGVRLR